MSEKPDYILEIGRQNNGSPENAPGTNQTSITSESPCNRPYISVLFECCGIYQRIYRSRQGDSYQGRCPKCLKLANVKIGSGGTSSRFFTAR